MTARLKTYGAVALALLVAGCGYAEWPPKSEVRRDVESGRPVAAGAAAAFRGATAVIVGRGDTVYGLSRRHGVSMRAIIVANGLEAPFHLSVGQRIELPRDPEYTVATGDTLSGIAAARNLGMYDLARLNGLEPPYTIYVGQRLRLPGADASMDSDGEVKTVSVSPNAGKPSAPKPAPLPTTPPACSTPTS